MGDWLQVFLSSQTLQYLALEAQFNIVCVLGIHQALDYLTKTL